MVLLWLGIDFCRWDSLTSSKFHCATQKVSMKRLSSHSLWIAWLVAVWGPVLPVPGAVVINEIHYLPSSLTVAEEFVELFNTGPDAVDLTGWRFVDGIYYTFPPETGLEAGGYLIVAARPESYTRLDPSILVLGPYGGILSNDGENVALAAPDGAWVDHVAYQDEEGWPPEADGQGPSLERLHPEMPSSQPASWTAGPPGGTPGRKNQNAIPSPLPVVTDVRHDPVTPASYQSVWIRGRVIHNRPLQAVYLFYKEEDMAAYVQVEMFDDGLRGDEQAGDGIYGGEIPGFRNGQIIEFYIRAVDEAGQEGLFPLERAGKPAIYLVDDSVYATSLPLYRIVMRAKDERTLRTRSVTSNEQLPATFISGTDVFYNVGVRFRGKGSRYAEPKSYRVDFTASRHFGTVRKMNLNAVNPHRQFVGLECFRILRMPAPVMNFVSLAFNQTLVPNYIQVERTDRYAMERLFGNGDGNLYRGIEQANLDYRGEDQAPYRPHYMKITNELQNDYTDIVDLCRAFSATSDTEFVEALSREINVRQWIRWFALKEILNDREGGLSLERGDDYYIYKNPGDDLFYLLPWDLDTVIVRPFEAVHHHGTPAVQRLLRHPELARFYYGEILNILDHELTPEVMDSIIDRTAPVATPNQRAEMKQIFREMREFLYASIPRALTVQVDNTSNVTLVQEGDTWRFFRGLSAPPADWKQNGFDDSAWESGPGGFGYGDNDDRTVLQDMQNNYTTVFIRRTFPVSSPDAYKRLILNVLVDDGFVAYLNGREVARLNVNGEPTYRSTASQSLEANQVQQFFVSNPSEILVAGENTLAIVGVNVNLTSSDLSLAVRLEGESYLSGFLRLRGRVDASLTTGVQVNGAAVDYVPWKAEWEYATGLADGRNVFRIEALNAEGQVLDATRVAIYHNVPPPSDGIEILGDEMWTAEQSPVRVEQNLFVPPADTLTIGAGVTVRMASGAAIIVQGTMTVMGTEDNPVRFVPQDEGIRWGGIVVDRARGIAEFHHAQFSGTREFFFRNVNYPAAVNVRASTAIVENSFFTAMDGLGIQARDSRLIVTGNHFWDMGEMLHCARSYAWVVGNRFEQVRGYSDAIDFDEGMDPASLIRGNTILGSEDDGVDLFQCSIRVENNWIAHCRDKGISLEGESTPVLINNVILDSNIGVAVKDACQAKLIHSTIVSCVTGVALYEKNPGQDSGRAEILNTVIWNTDRSLLWDEQSYLLLTHSLLMQLPELLQENNWSLDPLFEDPANGRLMPRPDSPLIDHGVPAGVAADIAGRARPQGAEPDIGAYEFFIENAVKTWDLHY